MEASSRKSAKADQSSGKVNAVVLATTRDESPPICIKLGLARVWRAR